MAITKIPAAGISSSNNFRNIIINGDMSIAQRGTSISASSSTKTYSLDRFFTRSNSNTNHTVVQSTDAPTGFKNSLYLTRDSGQTGSLIRLQQAVETNNMIYLRGKKVTLSFYAKKDSGATNSNLGINLYTGDGTERARVITAYDNEVNAISDTATLTTSWQKFTFTSSTLISDLSQLSIEIQYSGVGTAPSNDGYFITGVQLEAGTTASDFEFLPVDVNLARCFRYFQDYSVDLQFMVQEGRYGDTAGNWTPTWTFPNGDMRAIPTLTYTDQANPANLAKMTVRRADGTETNNINLRPFGSRLRNNRVDFNTYNETTGFGSQGSVGFAFAKNFKLDAEL